MPKPNTVRYTVDLDRDDVLWFKEQYPKASMTGILESLFSTFREVNEKTAREYIERAAEIITVEMRR